MPLAFDTLSHGTIAFGFFNIDSDMLLLEQYFLLRQIIEHLRLILANINLAVKLFRNSSNIFGAADIPAGRKASDRTMSKP